RRGPAAFRGGAGNPAGRLEEGRQERLPGRHAGRDRAVCRGCPVGAWRGIRVIKSLFVAAAFVATSAGITARVLQELGVLQRTESRVILGAAVIDDILAMLLLGVVSSLQGSG